MSTIDRTAIAGPKPRMLTRRGVIKGGLGLAGVAGLVLPAAGARAAMEAANGLVITDYRLSPPAWPKGQRLTITVVADLHAGGPNMGLDRVRQVVDAANELRSDLTVVLGDFFRHPPFRDRTRAAPGLGGGACRGCTRRLVSIQSWAITIGGTTSTAVRRALDKVRLPVMENDARPVGRARAALLACRSRRPDRLLARPEHVSKASTICPARWRASAPTIR